MPCAAAVRAARAPPSLMFLTGGTANGVAFDVIGR